MRLEVRIYEERGRRQPNEMMDAFCIFGGSNKRLTRGRVKKLLRRYFKHRWFGFVSKTPDGVYHAMLDIKRMKEPPRWVCRYVYVETLTEGVGHVRVLL